MSAEGSGGVVHFHQVAKCMNCKAEEPFLTPLPDEVFAGDLCRSCGAPDMIGWDPELRAYCKDCSRAYSRRIVDRWMRSMHGYP